MGLVDFVIVRILRDLPCCFQDQNPTESRALCLFFLSAGPRVHPAVSARLNWGHYGFSRLCHLTCFFTSTIRLWPRLSRALLLSLFSMPDKLLSGCRSFRFFWHLMMMMMLILTLFLFQLSSFQHLTGLVGL